MLNNAKQLIRRLLFGSVRGTDSNDIRVDFIYPLIRLGSLSFPGFRRPQVFLSAQRLTIDLGACRFIEEIRFPLSLLAARPAKIPQISVHFSVDAVNWHSVEQMNARRYVTASEGVIALEAAAPLCARFVAFPVQAIRRRRRGRLSIKQSVPPLKFGEAANLSVAGARIFCDYLSTHTFGLFSNCSTSLADVIRLLQAGITVRGIRFERGMMQFKDDDSKDVYPVFFEPSASDDASRITVSFNAQVDNHRNYKDLPLNALGIQVKRFFWPSRLVRDVAGELQARAGVEVKNTLAVYYRGTDKSQEVQLASAGDYIAAIESIDEHSVAKLDLLIQTDQAQVLEAFVARFGARVRVFDSIPTTRGSVGIHDLDFVNDLKLSRERFAVELLAAVYVISQCAVVMTTTSNVALWIALYRGNARDLYQFNAEGKLV